MCGMDPHLRVEYTTVGEGSWVVRTHGLAMGDVYRDRKNDAVHWARRKAKANNASLIITNKDGTVQETVDHRNNGSPGGNRGRQSGGLFGGFLG